MCGWNAAKDALSGPDVTTAFERTRVTSVAVAMGQYTETQGTGRGGGVPVQKVSRKGYRKGVLVQEGGGFLCRKESRKGSRKGFPVQEGWFLWGSWDSSWPGRGGGFLCRKGVPVGFLCTSCPHNYWQAFILNVMQKAVANFFGSVLCVTPYWDLEVDARRQRQKCIRDVVVRALCLDMTTSLCAQPVTV